MRLASVLVLTFASLAGCSGSPDSAPGGLDSVDRMTPLELRISMSAVSDDQALKEFGRDLAKRLETPLFFTADGGYTLVYRPAARKTVPLHSIPGWARERNLEVAAVEVIAFGRLVRATGQGIVGVQVALSIPGSGQRVPLVQGGAGDEARSYLELATSLRFSSRDVTVRGALVPTGDGAGITVQEFRYEGS